MDRNQPRLSLTSIIHNGARAHTQPRESPPPPARQDAGTSNPRPFIAPEPNPTSDADSIHFPEPPPQNRRFVWEDMQQLTLAPMFYNLHNPRGFIKDQGEWAYIPRSFSVTHFVEFISIFQSRVQLHPFVSCSNRRLARMTDFSMSLGSPNVSTTVRST